MGSPDTSARLAALVDDLQATGALTDPRWRDAFLQVPRHLFIPDPIWADDGARADGWMVPVGRDDPYWWENVYADYALPTQVDDGTPAGTDGRGRYTTSSASQPSLVARMLEALHVTDGMRVLEIGTATGYNAACDTRSHRSSGRQLLNADFPGQYLRPDPVSTCVAGNGGV